MGTRASLGQMIPAAPFRAWIRAELDELRADPSVKAPNAILAGRLNRDTRWVYRWTEGEYRDVETIAISTAAAALSEVGLAIWEIDDPDGLWADVDDRPDPVARFCEGCAEDVTTDATLICPWCETPTLERALARPAPRSRSCRIADDEILALYRLHRDRGVSLNALGRRIWQAKGYASAESATAAISAAFRRHAFPARDRITAVRAAAA